ncbi:MAG: isocitrate lyase/phosphoenolpyruvate mutase family protein [Pseudomonadota bacterium]
MSQAEKAELFRAMHVPGEPVVLYNIWDAGGAKALVDAGSPAVATGSWSVAGAHGYRDGEAMPLDLLCTVVSRIAATVDVPVSVDFEGGFAVEPAEVRENVRRIIGAGAIGINFEDQVVGGDGLHETAAQADRIAAVRAAGEVEGVPLFINARTDLFLKAKDPESHAALIFDAAARGAAYKAAGADGFFVPGLADTALIGQMVKAVELPLNIMMRPPLDAVKDLAAEGVARVSYGPGPYAAAMKDLARRYAATLE